LDHNPLQWLDEKFTRYLSERREDPRDDVLTMLATAKYPDGETPEVSDVAKSATFLFAAGQETTTKLLTSGMRFLAENPELQQTLRSDPHPLPIFVEETLRMESPVKSDFRLVRKTTTLGDVELPAGTTVMVCPGAVNRDPRRFESPNEFQVERANVREHLAFGRGVHSCPGGPLARVEGRVTFERALARMGDIRINETKHGAPDDRRYTYEPTFILRGLTELHLEYTPL
jgi:cytochrome P450